MIWNVSGCFFQGQEKFKKEAKWFLKKWNEKPQKANLYNKNITFIIKQSTTQAIVYVCTYIAVTLSYYLNSFNQTTIYHNVIKITIINIIV